MLRVLLFAALAQVSFDVASVKPAPANEPYPEIEVQPGGQFIASHATLRELILYAYDLREFQLDGGADWTRSRRFDVMARASQGANARQARAMLQILLRDRFALRVRTETRTVPVYELLTASRDDRLGPQLKRSAIDCSAVLDGREIFDMSPVQSGNAECRPGGKSVVGPTGATIVLIRKGMTMPSVARLLTFAAERPVIDKTGLPGTYDLELSYSPPVAFYVTRDDGIKVANDQGAGTPLVTAVREQLGLRLESARGPGTVLVIESAQPPSAD